MFPASIEGNSVKFSRSIYVDSSVYIEKYIEKPLHPLSIDFTTLKEYRVSWIDICARNFISSPHMRL